MQEYSDMISFVYSDNGTFFFQKLYSEVEQMQKKNLPLKSSHYIEELQMTLMEALNLAVSATFAVQEEFMGKDHHKDYDDWQKKHPQEEMDYQTWINRSLIYQLDELKLTDINTTLSGISERPITDERPVEKKKKRRGFWGRRAQKEGSGGSADRK